MRVRTTSTQRTYRYVRLSLVGVIALLGVSVTVQSLTGGPLLSVSAAYYTPARDVFVGALCAVSLALLALSGRSIEQVLLDIAALFAPVIALVPTPVETGDVSGVPVACPADESCVPAPYLPGIANGVLSLAIIGVLGLGLALGVAVVQGTLERSVRASLAVAAGVVGGMALWWTLSPDTFILGAHNVSAIVFFGLMAAVAALAAWRPLGAGAVARKRPVRVAYGVIAAGILAALVLIGLVVGARALGFDGIDASPVPLFLVGEAAALLLFAAFWVVQTAELWNDPDPRLRGETAARVRRPRRVSGGSTPSR